ncbi:MAG TPA: TadE family protein [Thermoanaerobaculia bacterium]|nr:TadE family protein [Thermoanaerobaculia bacterium]
MRRHSLSDIGRPAILSKPERGQGSVEFVLFLVALVLCLFLMIQLAWIGVQKWQFNHFAHYAARSWSVDKKDRSPRTIMLEVQGRSILGWKLLSRDWVKYMWAMSPSTNSDGIHGVRYHGITQLFPLYRNFIGINAIVTSEIADLLKTVIPGAIPALGLVMFETFVPMEHEAEENPQRWDNDCSDPCDDNKR